jgi:hypothetical protein
MVSETKLDGYKFEFLLGKNASSLNDETYSSFTIRMYNAENEEDNNNDNNNNNNNKL